MSYRTILVDVETGAAAGKEVQLAIDLARQYEAALIGIAAAFPHAPMYFSGVGGGPDFIDVERDEIKAEFRKAEARFRSATEGTGLEVEWRSALEFPTLTVTRAAVAADLVVIGRPSGESASDPFRSVVLGDLLMGVGRPVLLAPAGMGAFNARNVLVAWKDSVEARRALSDALPMLKRAQQVVLVEIGDDGGSLQDAKAFLAKHQVTARAERIAAEGATEAQLVRLAQKGQADLIVACAYGHSRLREWVLGGVTRELLAGCPIACFFSH